MTVDDRVPVWWRDAVGYEIYIRSFADASGDGFGDLDGLTERLDYLAWLGVTVLWVTPFYPSPGHDAGYDVADYTDVDPAFGDLAAFDRCVARAHELGLRLMVDLVPNHTSSDHPWFVAARSGRDDPHRNWFHWRDGAPGGGPPNNWLSTFGGPAWTYDDATGQWWLHQFLPEQPDLNWAEPGVADAFDDILDFWIDRGVDGVRIDVAHGLAKHPELPDLPAAQRVSPRQIGTAREYATLEHVHDMDQDAVLDVYRRWRPKFTATGGVAVGEVYLDDPERVARYVRDSDGLHASFWFPLQEASWSASELRHAIDDGLSAGRVRGDLGVGIAWATDSHDQGRTPTRFGGGERGRRRSLALTALMMCLPGVPFLYQGQELGLVDGQVPDDRVQDPIALRHGQPERGRDPARTPMPWRPGPGMGFTAADVEPWLPFGGRQPDDTVEVQRADAASWLHAHRQLVQLRRSQTDLVEASHSWLDQGGEMLAFRRGRIITAANCGDSDEKLQLPGGDWEVLWATPHMGPQVEDGRLILAADAAVLLRAVEG